MAIREGRSRSTRKLSVTTAHITAKARTPERWLTTIVLSLLLVTQGLSLTHAVAHATRNCGESAANARCEESATSGPRGSWIDAVLSVTAHHDDESPLCRLIDHLCHAAPAPSVPEIAAQTSVYPLPHVAKIGRWASLALGHYSARAPPALS